MTSVPYKKIHIVINPASGKDEPIINILNDVFKQYDVEWEISITHKYGDAMAQAKEAIANGADLVVGYGGDGTQHEIANAVLGTETLMGILPGGTGNGFAREMNIPATLRPAVEVLCTSPKVRKIDVGQVNGEYFIQRMYVGIEPEEQTSREMKDRYGVFAYAISMYQQRQNTKQVKYQVTVDGADPVDFEAFKVYVVNSGMMGSGYSINKMYAIDDGLLDAFVLNSEMMETFTAAASRFFNRDTVVAKKYYRQLREVTIDTEPDQPVWVDGEYIGRTPVAVKVIPGALSIVVP